MHRFKLWQQHKAMQKKLYGKRYPLTEIKKIANKIKKSKDDFYGRQKAITSAENSTGS